MGFKEFCDKYGIQLKLTSPYNLESSGAAERGVRLVKKIMKKTEEDGSCMEEAMSVFRNTRNKSGLEVERVEHKDVCCWLFPLPCIP